LKAGRSDVISLWAGQGAGRLKYRRARDVFDGLVARGEGAL
jgi:hypothetical protein